MQTTETDDDVMRTIHQLVEEQRGIYNNTSSGGGGVLRLEVIRVELDRCWDLIRQRHALARIGEDPRRARVRDAAVVERYEG